MADDETIVGIARAVDTATEHLGSDTPNWAPLSALLPLEDCDGFMWMGAVLQPRAVYVHGRCQDRVIFQYKHGITRHYLMIDPTDLNTWWHLGDPGHVVIPREAAIEAAFEGLEMLGATRSTRYDDEYRAQRNARLAAARYTVIPEPDGHRWPSDIELQRKLAGLVFCSDRHHGCPREQQSVVARRPCS